MLTRLRSDSRGLASMLRIRLPSGDHAVRCLVADFDMTLARLFTKDGLQEARRSLARLYRQAGVPRSILAPYGDVYLLYRMVYLWTSSTWPPERASAVNRAASRHLEDVEFSLAQSAVLLPGVKETVEWLRACDVKLAVVSTNAQSVVEYCLQATGIADLVNAVVGRRAGTTAAELKPSPATIAEALRLLSSEPGVALYIGDSIGDMKAGKSAGLVTVGVTTGQVDRRELLAAGADAVVTAFADIRRLALV